MSALSLAVAMFSIVSAHASDWEPTLESIEQKFEEIYCFKDLKRELFDWDAKTEMNRVRSELRSSWPPVTDRIGMRKALSRFYDSTRDIHVAPTYKTSSPYEVTRLPVLIRSAERGVYIIVKIDREALPSESFPIEIGDEVVSVGGQPVQALVDEFLPSVYAQKRTQQALAERYAFLHYDEFGKSMPVGKTTLEVRSARTGQTKSYEVEWKATPKSSKKKQTMIRKGGHFIIEAELNPVVEARLADENPVSNYAGFNARNPFFPPIGEVLWQSAHDAPYYAYIATIAGGKKAGFVRVPTYYPENIGSVVLPAFEALVDRFVDEGISVLVYDQTNNAGGSLLYAYDLLSALIDQPVDSPMKTEWIVSETHHELGAKWVDLKALAERALSDSNARTELATKYFSDKRIDDDFIRGFIALSEIMLQTLSSPNRPRLSPAYPFEGLKQIKPRNGKRYTGPMLMLVNELSVSSADLAPALFQDLKRAVIFGSRTAGAGAYQNAYMAPEGNPFELWYSSISFGKFTRGNGAPVENFGVKPDVRYDVTTNDLRNGMSGYAQAVRRAAEELASRSFQTGP